MCPASARLAGALLASGSATVLGVALASNHPVCAPAALIGFALWCAMVFRYPGIWLILLPASLPVLGFAAWTGWIAFDEFDLAILGTAAGAYASYAAVVLRPNGGPRTALPPLSVYPPHHRAVRVFGALAATTVLSLAVGLFHAGQIEFDWFDGYDTALNSIRVAKSTFEFLLVVPLLMARHRSDPQGSADALGLGMTIGVGLASTVALWERLAFTGFADFSHYYRTSGLFVEGHVGGASFDVYLALGMPFVVRAVAVARTRLGRVAAVLTLLLAVYACLTTLSRSLFLGLAIGAAFGIWFLRSRSSATAGSGSTCLHRTICACVLAGILAASAQAAFLAWSYAGIAAMAFLGTLWAWAAIAWRTGRLRSIQFFLAVTLSLAATGTCIAWVDRGGESPAFAVVCLAMGSAVAAGAAILSARWDPVAGRRSQLVLLGITLALTGERAAILAGDSFVSRRFDQAASDIDARFRHWSGAVMLLRTPVDWALGRGIGRFPAEYANNSDTVEFPGGFKVIKSEGEHFARVYGPATRDDMAGVFGLSQRIGSVDAGAYSAAFEVRAFRATRVQVAICERHLIYETACAGESVVLEPGDWRSVEVRFDAANLGAPVHFARPAYFSFAVRESARAVDLRRLQLTGPAGKPILANGEFADGGARWFLTGRYFFLPWHTDSVWLELLVERGVAGLTVWLWLLACAFAACRTATGSARKDAPWFIAALVAMLVAGSLGSVLDVPRVAFVVQLLTGYWLLLPASVTGKFAKDADAPLLTPQSPAGASPGGMARAVARW